ncbi:unnamed protein product [Spirodela intermedia]|uniref:Uncharacterized protein n=2 Tax=Spirodela intermedia TaxID=51605 RepID=A0A7I8KNJ0_SPIIN|nr:unnamed protein product [Spirodela intermedia]CAA6662950.1 unnamed protein product [Spirodela intermedia]CAA7399373.1 unnamed protein product [Spirodela intermedia]
MSNRPQPCKCGMNCAGPTQWH